MVDPTLALKAALSNDNVWLERSTIAVFVGVVVEMADLLFFNKEMRLWQRSILLFGVVLVVAGCGGEWKFEHDAAQVESQLQQLSDEKVAALTSAEANDNRIATLAASDAGKLGVNVSNEHSFVQTQEGRLNAQMGGFRIFASQAETQTKAEIAQLDQNRTQLGAASAQAQQAAKDAAAQLEEMRRANTPRTLSDEQFAALVSALKPFPGTQIDFATIRDPNDVAFLERIEDAVLAAGWKPQPWNGMGFGLTLTDRPDSPTVGEGSGRGVQVTIAEANKSGDLGNAGLALAGELKREGLLVFAIEEPEKLPNGKPNPAAVKAGSIHLTVGTKQ